MKFEKGKRLTRQYKDTRQHGPNNKGPFVVNALYDNVYDFCSVCLPIILKIYIRFYSLKSKNNIQDKISFIDDMSSNSSQDVNDDYY